MCLTDMNGLSANHVPSGKWVSCIPDSLTFVSVGIASRHGVSVAADVKVNSCASHQ